MKNDKELLKELVEYFDGVMDDVVEGKPFEKRDVPDYRGHELDYRIGMLIVRLHDIMCTYSAMRNFIFRTNGTYDGVRWPNVNELLEKYEKEYKNKNNEQVKQ